MNFCRYCGTEISYKRSKNEKWIPCNFYTGEPHFCQETKGKTSNTQNGIKVCDKCGKPVFSNKVGRYIVIYDYTTLQKHECKNADITRYTKYIERQKKLNSENKEKSVSKKKPSATKTKKTRTTVKSGTSRASVSKKTKPESKSTVKKIASNKTKKGVSNVKN